VGARRRGRRGAAWETARRGRADTSVRQREAGLAVKRAAAATRVSEGGEWRRRSKCQASAAAGRAAACDDAEQARRRRVGRAAAELLPASQRGSGLPTPQQRRPQRCARCGTHVCCATGCSAAVQKRRAKEKAEAIGRKGWERVRRRRGVGGWADGRWERGRPRGRAAAARPRTLSLPCCSAGSRRRRWRRARPTATRRASCHRLAGSQDAVAGAGRHAASVRHAAPGSMRDAAAGQHSSSTRAAGRPPATPRPAPKRHLIGVRLRARGRVLRAGLAGEGAALRCSSLPLPRLLCASSSSSSVSVGRSRDRPPHAAAWLHRRRRCAPTVRC
jgi:hypothetical protein